MPFIDLAIENLPSSFTEWVISYRLDNEDVLPPVSDNPLAASVADDDDVRPAKKRKMSALI